MAPLFDLRQGDVLQRLREIPSDTVSCCVTSVPYWGLRSYNVPASVWPNGWTGCLGLEPSPQIYLSNMVAVFREVRRVLHSSGTLWLNIGDSYCSDAGADPMPTTLAGPRVPAGWTNRAQPRRVHALRAGTQPRGCPVRVEPSGHTEGLKPKDLCMMPARLALALQEDGWWLRCQIPWLKSNPMPESCTDRPGSSVEYIYLLAKSEAYFYDREAVRIHSSRTESGNVERLLGDGARSRLNTHMGSSIPWKGTTRSRRNTDWFFASMESYTQGFQGLLVDAACDPLALLVNPQPFSLEMCANCKTCYEQREYRKLELHGKTRRCCCGASEWISHFATFPERMVTPCILAGTSEHGRCRACGAPYERVVERSRVGDWHPDPGRKHDAGAVNGTAKWAKSAAVDARNGMKLQSSAGTGSHTKENPPAPATLGWRPTCSHPLFESEIVPCVVLDPFSGSGRTGLVANRYGRDFIGIEANGDYVRMAEWQKSKQMVERVGTP
jgi:DNA modification methylase